MVSHGIIRWSGLFMTMKTITVKATKQVSSYIPCKGVDFNSQYQPELEDVLATARWVLEHRRSVISGPTEEALRRRVDNLYRHDEKYLKTTDTNAARRIHFEFGREVGKA